MAAGDMKSFISEMQAKYFPGNPQRRGFSAPVFGELPRLDRAAQSMPGSALGTRFTGRGPDNVTQIHEPAVAGGGASELDTTIAPQRARSPVQASMAALEKEGIKGYYRGGSVSQPIGIAHEGETIVSAADTAAAGGPEKISRAVAIMKQAQKNGVPGFAAGNLPDPNAPSQGLNPIQMRDNALTESSNVARTGVVNLDGIQKAITGLQGGYQNTPVKTTIKIDPVNAAATQQGMKEMTNQMQTGGQAVQTQAKIARQTLGAQQGAETSQLKSQMAQMGVQGGEAMAATANANRTKAVAQAGLEGQIAATTAQSAQEAAKNLVDAGFQGQQIDLQKANFGLQAEQLQEMKNEYQAKYGMDIVTMLVDASKFGIEMGIKLYIQYQNHGDDMIHTMLSMPEPPWDQISGVLETMGITGVDFTNTKDLQNASGVATAMTSFRAAVKQNANREEANKYLSTAWNLMHPENPAGPDNAEFKVFSNENFTTQTYMRNPNYEQVSSLAGPGAAMFVGLLKLSDKTGPNGEPSTLSKFEYGGASGAEAVTRFFTDAKTSGALDWSYASYDSSGAGVGGPRITLHPDDPLFATPGLENIFTGSDVNRTVTVNGTSYDLATAFDDPTKLIGNDGRVTDLSAGGGTEYLASKLPTITTNLMNSTGTGATDFNNAVVAMAAGVLDPTLASDIPVGEDLGTWINGTPASGDVQAVAGHGAFLNINGHPMHIDGAFDLGNLHGVQVTGRDGTKSVVVNGGKSAPIPMAAFTGPGQTTPDLNNNAVKSVIEEISNGNIDLGGNNLGDYKMGSTLHGHGHFVVAMASKTDPKKVLYIDNKEGIITLQRLYEIAG